MVTPNWLARQDVIDSWTAACARFVADDEAFNDFRPKRSTDAVHAVVDNRPSEWTPKLWKLAIACGLDPEREYPAMQLADAIGNPIDLYPLDDGRHPLSATGSAYVWSFADIRWLFGEMTGWRIAELGGGYGGLGAIITRSYDVACYDLYDLPDPAMFQAKYIARTSGYVANPSPKFDTDYDLVIAACSFSELSGQLRSDYTKRLFRRSKRGYLIWSNPPVAEHSPEWIGYHEAFPQLAEWLLPKRLYWRWLTPWCPRDPDNFNKTLFFWHDDWNDLERPK